MAEIQYLSHASPDKGSVKAATAQLNKQGIPTWLDEWNLLAEDPGVDAPGKALRECAGCVVFHGPGGARPWHHEEVLFALDLAVRNSSYRPVPIWRSQARRGR